MRLSCTRLRFNILMELTSPWRNIMMTEHSWVLLVSIDWTRVVIFILMLIPQSFSHRDSYRIYFHPRVRNIFNYNERDKFLFKAFSLLGAQQTRFWDRCKYQQHFCQWILREWSGHRWYKCKDTWLWWFAVCLIIRAMPILSLYSHIKLKIQ